LQASSLPVTVQLRESGAQTVSPKASEKPRALFLAGHPVLDFLNTRMRVREDVVDLLQSNEDVLRWLKQAGFPVPAFSRKAKPPELLGSARCLRENIRCLLEKRKLGKRGDPAALNRFLMAGRSYAHLMWRKSRFKIETVREQETAGSILAPIAEAAADLLTKANFELLKRCEAQTCVLWFCDRTRSHRRRWCSVEICGNRHKVAAYRKRLRDRSSRS